MGRPTSDLVGKVFGPWAVRSIAPRNSWRSLQSEWIVACDQGHAHTIRASDIKAATGRSTCSLCAKHGHAAIDGPTYRSWSAMRERCLSPNHHAYSRYGGRGIAICEPWSRFPQFLRDMGERPVGMTLDRIDSNGDYEPDNCRWATVTQQNRNTRATKLTEAGAAEIRIAVEEGAKQRDLATAYGVSESVISNIVNGKTWHGR